MELSLRSIRRIVAAFSITALIATFAIFTGVANAAAVDVYGDVSGGEWYEADVDWGLTVGLLDSDQAYFRGGDNATRAEFFKMTAVGAGMTEAPCDETLFPDMDSTHWACGWVTAMAESGIVGGDGADSDTPGYVRPNDNIVRAEAGKVVVEAYGLTGDGTLGSDKWTDVPAGAWFDDYMGVAWYNCVYQGVSGGTTVDPGRNIVRAEAVAVVHRGAEPNQDCHLVGPSGALTVNVDGSTPASVDIPKNGSNIPFTVLALTASADEDLRVEELVLTREGLGLPGDFDSVKLYVDGVQFGSQKTVNTSTNTATFSLAGDPIMVSASSTVLVTVRADMAGADNSQNTFCVSYPEDVLVYGESSNEQVDVGGSFAACGNFMTTTSAEVGTLTYEFDDYTGDINIGEENVSAAKVKLEADNTEDMDVMILTWKQRGSADPMDFSNPALYVSGVQIADSSVATWEGDFLTFDLSGDPLFIERGNSKNVELRVDVVGGLGSTMLFEIYRDWHIEATGRVYHYGVNVEECSFPCVPPTVTARDIIGGNLAFALSAENPTVGDMLGDADDHTFVVFNVSTAGDAVTLNGFDVIITYNAVATDQDMLQDVKVLSKNSADDWVSIGTLDPPAAVLGAWPATHTLNFTDTWDLAANTTTPFMITADGNNALNTSEFFITFDANSVDAEYSEGDPVAAADISGGLLDGNIQTVSLPTLDVGLASAPGDMFIVGGTQDVEPINWDLSASSAADILVTSVTVTCRYLDTSLDGDDCSDVYSNLELNLKDGTEYTPLDTAVMSAGAVNAPNDYTSTAVFNGVNFTIPAGQVYKLALTANTSKSGDATDAAIFNIAFNADVSAEYSEDTITPTVDATVVQQTFLGAGTLTVSVDATTPASDTVVGGETNVHVAKVKFTADENENILLQKLRLTNDYLEPGGQQVCTDAFGATSADNAFASAVYITDGTTEFPGVLSGGVLGIGGTVEFDMTANPYLVPMDGNVSLDVFVDTNMISTGGADSGHCLSLSLADLDGVYGDYDVPGGAPMDLKAVGGSSGTGLDNDVTGNVLGGTGYSAGDLYDGGHAYYVLRDNNPYFTANENTPDGNGSGGPAEEVLRFDVDITGSGTATFDTMLFSEYGTCATGSVAPYTLYWAATGGDVEIATSADLAFIAAEFVNLQGIEMDAPGLETFYLEANMANPGGCLVDETATFTLTSLTWWDGEDVGGIGSLTETDIDDFPVDGGTLRY